MSHVLIFFRYYYNMFKYDFLNSLFGLLLVILSAGITYYINSLVIEQVFQNPNVLLLLLASSPFYVVLYLFFTYPNELYLKDRKELVNKLLR